MKKRAIATKREFDKMMLARKWLSAKVRRRMKEEEGADGRAEATTYRHEGARYCNGRASGRAAGLGRAPFSEGPR